MKNNLWIYVLSGLIYFGQGIEKLPGQSFFYYLKETLHYSESKIMFLGSLIGLAWLIKPLIGYLIDVVGWSKKKWISVSLISTIAICLFIGLSPILSIPVIVGLLIFYSANTALRDVSIDGLMCVEGKKNNIAGKIQSIQWIAITLASVLVGIGGGYLAEKLNYQLIYLFIIPFYFLMLLGVKKYKEPKKRIVPHVSLIQMIKKLVGDKNLLLASLFIFLYNFAPSFGTPLMFIERDVFHWSKTFIGGLASISAVLSIVGAIVYYHFSSKINLKKGLTVSVFIATIISLGYLYFTPVTGIIYTLVGSFIGMFINLMLLDFMARNTKNGMEATSFALLCSVGNLAGTCNGLVGAWLFPIVGLSSLIIISAGSTLLCLPLIKRLKI